jgi:hypothetical protein
MTPESMFGIAILVTFIIVGIVTIIVVMVLSKKQEGLSSQPTKEQAEQYATHIMKNPQIVGGYQKAKELYGWMDPVVYEDVRRVMYKGLSKNPSSSINKDALTNAILKS